MADFRSEENTSDDIVVEETPEYSPKSEFNKAQIVSDAVRKCMELRAKPMVPGFTNTRQSSDGSTIQSREDDARQAYVSAVIALRNLLYPEIKRDKIIKEFVKSFELEDKELKKKYEYEDFDFERGKEGTWKIVKNGRRFMPEIDEILKTSTIKANMSEPVTLKGYWNAYVNAYWDLKAELYDKLFAEIQCLIDRLNYFKPEISF